MILKDKRLPQGYYVFKNNFNEYVVCQDENTVAQIDGENVSASIDFEKAIQYFLNGETKKHAYLGD